MIAEGREKSGSDGNEHLTTNQKCGVCAPRQTVKGGYPPGNPVNERMGGGRLPRVRGERVGNVRVSIEQSRYDAGNLRDF